MTWWRSVLGILGADSGVPIRPVPQLGAVAGCSCAGRGMCGGHPYQADDEDAVVKLQRIENRKLREIIDASDVAPLAAQLAAQDREIRGLRAQLDGHDCAAGFAVERNRLELRLAYEKRQAQMWEQRCRQQGRARRKMRRAGQ